MGSLSTRLDDFAIVYNLESFSPPLNLSSNQAGTPNKKAQEVFEGDKPEVPF